jgi:hypothetical protein
MGEVVKVCGTEEAKWIELAQVTGQQRVFLTMV